MVRDENGEVIQGSLARVEPEGETMRMWEAIETYMNRKQPLIIIADNGYGEGGTPLVIHRKDGSVDKAPVKCRLDTADEVKMYNSGGMLQRFAKEFLEGSVA